jgi:hypothetical protein
VGPGFWIQGFACARPNSWYAQMLAQVHEKCWANTETSLPVQFSKHLLLSNSLTQHSSRVTISTLFFSTLNLQLHHQLVVLFPSPLASFPSPYCCELLQSEIGASSCKHHMQMPSVTTHCERYSSWRSSLATHTPPFPQWQFVSYYSVPHYIIVLLSEYLFLFLI